MKKMYVNQKIHLTHIHKQWSLGINKNQDVNS